jgi:hypothetical protein
VISRDVCVCFNKRVSVNIGCCGVLWFSSSLVCSVFLIMFPEVYSDVVRMSYHIPGSMCFGVTVWLGWVVWYPYAV